MKEMCGCKPCRAKACQGPEFSRLESREMDNYGTGNFDVMSGCLWDAQLQIIHVIKDDKKTVLQETI